MVKVELTERQAEYLNDILDMWIEGHEAAAREAQDVDCIYEYKTPEEMLQTLDTLNWQHSDAIDIKLKLMEARR